MFLIDLVLGNFEAILGGTLIVSPCTALTWFGMKTVILAGGIGSRLHPLTKVTPKPLLPLAGRPILEYIIEGLVAQGFRDIVIVARYLGDQIVKYFGSNPYAKPLLLDSKDTADAVRLVANLLDDHFIVTMGDTISNVSYRDVVDSHMKSNPVATIALKQVENPLPYGIVYLNEYNDVLLFVEKPLSIEVYLLSLAYYRQKGVSSYENLINAGIYVFNPHILEVLLRNPGLMDFGRHVFPYLIENGYKVKGYVLRHDTYWNDIGRIETYKAATWDLLGGLIQGVSPGGVEVSQGVYAHDSTVIKGEVRPPVYLGRKTIIEEGAIVGPYASIEDGVVVGRGTIVKESIIWHNTVIGGEARIYDSIVMNNVDVAPGSTLVSSIIGTGNQVNGILTGKTLNPVEAIPPYA